LKTNLRMIVDITVALLIL